MNRSPRKQISSLPTYTLIVWCLVCALVLMSRPRASIAAEDDLVVTQTSPLPVDVLVRIDDERLGQLVDNMVFGHVVVDGRVVRQDRSSIDEIFEKKIRELTVDYDLNQEKQNRLRLVAMSEKSRFDREVDKLRERFRKMPKTIGNLNLIRNEASSLGLRGQSLLGPNSFFSKASMSILAGESFSKRPVVINEDLTNYRGSPNRRTRTTDVNVQAAVFKDNAEQLRVRHRGNVESAVREMNWRIGMNNLQRQELVDLLLRETLVPTSRGDFDDIAVKFRFSQIPEDKLKPLFEEDQWPRVVPVINGYREFKPVLVRYGLIDADGRFPDQPADAATPVNRGPN